MDSNTDRLLADYIQSMDVIRATDMAVVSDVCARSGQTLVQVLGHLELLDDKSLRACLSQVIGFPPVNTSQYRVDEQAVEQLGVEYCRRHALVPLLSLREKSQRLIALSDPHDIVVCDQLRHRLNDEYLTLGWADSTEILDLLRASAEKPASSHTSSGAEALLDRVLLAAVLRGCSDIHIEPAVGCGRIRFRCDGVLQLWEYLKLDDWQLLIGRIKVISGLDIAESRAPQDGRLSHSMDGRTVDVRVAAMPTDAGEAIVMRLLDRQRQSFSAEALCMDSEQQELLQRMLNQPDGLLLFCGPTGSGKSTTLYTAIESLRAEQLNIITLEDPVEYPVNWVRQTSINDAVSMNFAEGVRAALRQDPDVMLVGELRDADTAKVALRAAMTGHRVLTTLHANSALASIARLQDLGLTGTAISGNLIGVVSQRLLRRLCGDCKVLESDDTYSAKGCTACYQTGYTGRVLAAEIWPVDSDFDELVHRGASLIELRRMADRKNIPTLESSVSRLVKRGTTSLAEAGRVLGMGFSLLGDRHD